PPAPFEHTFDKSYRGMVDRLVLDNYFLFVYNSQWTSDWGPPPSKAYSLLVDEIRKNANDREHIAAHYDEGIVAVDRALETLWAELKRLGLYENTVIILTSDHGEELGEQGAFRHNFCLLDSVSRVPLVVRIPSVQGGLRVKPQVQLIDVAPTVLDLLNIPIPSTFTGVSLAPLLKGAAGDGPSPYAFSSSDTPEGRNALFSVRSEKWKLLRYANPPRQLLFDLTNDPKETADVAASHPDMTRDLSSRLDRWLARPKSPKASGVTLDEQELRRLRAMGYLR
ncbi:MAG: sulfatase/phosphatase domain-containing protein, partial [Elusimicrobiota bacterium]